ncbi:MAG TPA: hypothetical protein VIM98_10140, partial [Dyella sp.]|uniref:hypothetical protein n=1 Tax=Dyella sp. TaxID=1869338 RepID=UPI002F94426F
MITEPLPRDDDPHNTTSQQQYAVFCATVELLRTPPSKDNPHRYLPELTPGPVCQPAHVRALRSGDWKLVRYCDPWSPKPVPDQWELYNLRKDPTENINLVVYDGLFPTPIAASTMPKGVTPEEVSEVANAMREELARQETALLSPYPGAYPTGRA